MADPKAFSAPQGEWSEVAFRQQERELFQDRHLDDSQRLLKRIRLQLSFVFALQLRHREESEQVLLRKLRTLFSTSHKTSGCSPPPLKYLVMQHLLEYLPQFRDRLNDLGSGGVVDLTEGAGHGGQTTSEAALVLAVFEELIGRPAAEVFQQAGLSIEQPFEALRNYRVVLLGTGGSGKSSLINAFLCREFVTQYDPTVEDFHQVRVVVDGRACILSILDSAGQEEYSPLRRFYMQEGDGFMLCFALNSLESLDELTPMRDHILRIKGQVPNHSGEVRSKPSKGGSSALFGNVDQTALLPGDRYDDRHGKELILPVPFVMVGTKADLQPSRRISQRDAFLHASKLGCYYVESSAKAAWNITKPFEVLIRAIRRVDGEPASKEEEAWRKREARRRQHELAERERQMKYQQQALEVWKKKVRRKAKKEKRRREKGMKLLDKKLNEEPEWLQKKVAAFTTETLEEVSARAAAKATISRSIALANFQPDVSCLFPRLINEAAHCFQLVFRKFECSLPSNLNLVASNSDRYELFFSVFDRATQTIISEEFQVQLQLQSHSAIEDDLQVDSDEEQDAVQLSEIGDDEFTPAPPFASSSSSSSVPSISSAAATPPTEAASFTAVRNQVVSLLATDVWPSDAKKIALFTDLRSVEWKHDLVLVCRVVVVCARPLPASGGPSSHLVAQLPVDRIALGFGVAPMSTLMRVERKDRLSLRLSEGGHHSAGELKPFAMVIHRDTLAVRRQLLKGKPESSASRRRRDNSAQSKTSGKTNGNVKAKKSDSAVESPELVSIGRAVLRFRRDPVANSISHAEAVPGHVALIQKHEFNFHIGNDAAFFQPRDELYITLLSSQLPNLPASAKVTLAASLRLPSGWSVPDGLRVGGSSKPVAEYQAPLLLDEPGKWLERLHVQNVSVNSSTHLYLKLTVHEENQEPQDYHTHLKLASKDSFLTDGLHLLALFRKKSGLPPSQARVFYLKKNACEEVPDLLLIVHTQLVSTKCTQSEILPRVLQWKVLPPPKVAENLQAWLERLSTSNFERAQAIRIFSPLLSTFSSIMQNERLTEVHDLARKAMEKLLRLLTIDYPEYGSLLGMLLQAVLSNQRSFDGKKYAVGQQQLALSDQDAEILREFFRKTFSASVMGDSTTPRETPRDDAEDSDAEFLIARDRVSATTIPRASPPAAQSTTTMDAVEKSSIGSVSAELLNSLPSFGDGLYDDDEELYADAFSCGYTSASASGKSAPEDVTYISRTGTDRTLHDYVALLIASADVLEESSSHGRMDLAISRELALAPIVGLTQRTVDSLCASRAVRQQQAPQPSTDSVAVDPHQPSSPKRSAEDLEKTSQTPASASSKRSAGSVSTREAPRSRRSRPIAPKLTGRSRSASVGGRGHSSEAFPGLPTKYVVNTESAETISEMIAAADPSRKSSPSSSSSSTSSSNKTSEVKLRAGREQRKSRRSSMYRRFSLNLGVSPLSSSSGSSSKKSTTETAGQTPAAFPGVAMHTEDAPPVSPPPAGAVHQPMSLNASAKSSPKRKKNKTSARTARDHTPAGVTKNAGRDPTSKKSTHSHKPKHRRSRKKRSPSQQAEALAAAQTVTVAEPAPTAAKELEDEPRSTLRAAKIRVVVAILSDWKLKIPMEAQASVGDLVEALKIRLRRRAARLESAGLSLDQLDSMILLDADEAELDREDRLTDVWKEADILGVLWSTTHTCQ